MNKIYKSSFVKYLGLAFCLILGWIPGLAQEMLDLRNEIKKELRNQDLTGAVWSVVKDGDIYTDSWGIKNTDEQSELTSDNLVHVGSVTKSVLALGILRLATEGKLNIDDNVQKYIPELAFNNPWQKSNPITIRHLLDHTAGISDLALWQFLSTSSKPNTPLIKAFQKNKNLLDVHTKPGTLFSYSNMGFTILGMVIESATSQKYEVYLDENLLIPLGMENSSFQFISQIGKDANENLAMGHFEDGSTVASAPIYLRPAGQFTTTANDMALFLKFMMSDGTINNVPFVSPFYLEKLGTPKTTIAVENGLDNGYSFGVQKKDSYGRISLSHSGNIIGYKAYYYIFPVEKKAFFISYNMDHESADYNKINKIIINYLNGPDIKPSTTAFATEKELKSWNGYYVPVFSQFVPFRLLDYISGFTKFSVSQNGAEIVRFQGQSTHLKYKGKNLFQADDRIMPSHLFYKDKLGSLLVTNGTSTIILTKGINIVLIAASFILGILGIFHLLIFGISQIIRYKTQFFKDPWAWPFLSLIMLLVSILLIALQPFMNIGDLTWGSALLAISSVLLPVFSMITIIILVTYKKLSVKTLRFWGLLGIIQFSVLLFLNGMIPMTLWH